MLIPLTKYGLREIIAGSVFCLAGTVACTVFFWPAAGVFILLWAWLLSFFRDPERRADASPHDLLSPADTLTDVSLTPTLVWETALGAAEYIVVVDDNGDWSSP